MATNIKSNDLVQLKIEADKQMLCLHSHFILTAGYKKDVELGKERLRQIEQEQDGRDSPLISEPPNNATQILGLNLCRDISCKAPVTMQQVWLCQQVVQHNWWTTDVDDPCAKIVPIEELMKELKSTEERYRLRIDIITYVLMVIQNEVHHLDKRKKKRPKILPAFALLIAGYSDKDLSLDKKTSSIAPLNKPGFLFISDYSTKQPDYAVLRQRYLTATERQHARQMTNDHHNKHKKSRRCFSGLKIDDALGWTQTAEPEEVITPVSEKAHERSPRRPTTTTAPVSLQDALEQVQQEAVRSAKKPRRGEGPSYVPNRAHFVSSDSVSLKDIMPRKGPEFLRRVADPFSSYVSDATTAPPHHADARAKEMMPEIKQRGISLHERVKTMKDILGHKGKDCRGWSYFDQFADGEEITPNTTNMKPQDRVEYLTPLDCRTASQKSLEKQQKGSCPHYGVIGIKNPLSPEFKTRLAQDCNKARHLDPDGVGGDNSKNKNRFYRVFAFLYSMVFFMKNDKKHLRTAPDIAQSELRLMRTANLLAMCLDESTREKSEGRQFYRWAPGLNVCQSVVSPYDGTYDVHGDDSYNHCNAGDLPAVASTSTTKDRLEYSLPPRQLMLVITFVLSSLKGDSALLRVYNRKSDSDEPGAKIGEIKTTDNFVHVQLGTQDDCLHKVVEWLPRSNTDNHYRAIYSFRITIGPEQAEAYKRAVMNNSIDTTLVHDNYNQTNVLDHIQRDAAIKLVDQVAGSTESDSHPEHVSADATEADVAIQDLLEALEIPCDLWKDAHKKVDEPVIPPKLCSAPGDIVEKTLHSENLSVLRLSKTRVVVRHTDPPDPKKVISRLQQQLEGRRIQDRVQKARQRRGPSGDPDCDPADSDPVPSKKTEAKPSEYKAVHGQLPQMTIVELNDKGEEIPERTRRGIPLPGDIVKRESLRKELSLPDSNHANTTWNGVHPFLLNAVILVAAYKNDFLIIEDIQKIFNIADDDERMRLLHQIKLRTIKLGGAGGNGQQIGGFGSDFRSQDLVQPTPNSGVPHAQNPSAPRNETMQHAVRRNAMLSCWVPAMTPETKYALQNGSKAKYFQYLGMGVATSGKQDKMDELDAMHLAEKLSTKDRPNCQHLTENHYSFLLDLILYPPFYDCDRCDPSEWDEIEIHSDGQTRVHKQAIHESLVNPYKERDRVLSCRRRLRDSGQWLNCSPYCPEKYHEAQHTQESRIDEPDIVATNDSESALDAFRITSQTRIESPGVMDQGISETHTTTSETALGVSYTIVSSDTENSARPSHSASQPRDNDSGAHTAIYNSGCKWVFPGDDSSSCGTLRQLRIAEEELLLTESSIKQSKAAFDTALLRVVEAEEALPDATEMTATSDQRKHLTRSLTAAKHQCRAAAKANRADQIRHDSAKEALVEAQCKAKEAETPSSAEKENEFPFLEQSHHDVYNIVHYALNTNMNKLGFIEDFVSNCVSDISDGSAFDQKAQIKLPDSTVISLKLSVEAAVSINTACAYRALRDLVVLCETEKTINYLPNSGVTANLSQHSRCNPSPCCIRTNDVTTSFLMKVLQECGVWDREKHRNSNGTWTQMTIDSIDETTFCNILRTAMLFRLTGKVPALERYYQYARDDEYKPDRGTFYFLIERDDIEHFLTYVKRATTKSKSKNPMGVIFASEQYRASMYANCYETFAAFQHMVRSVIPKFEHTAKLAYSKARSCNLPGSTERPFSALMRRFSKEFSDCVKQEKNKASKNIWIPTQFMLDVAEVVRDPFQQPPDEEVVKGYGGTEGLLGLVRSNDVREKLEELESLEEELGIDDGAAEREAVASDIEELEGLEKETGVSEDDSSVGSEASDDRDAEDDGQKAKTAQRRRGASRRQSRKRRKVVKKIRMTIEQRLVKVMKILYEYLLNEVDDLRLQALGLYKREDPEGKTVLAVWINGRTVNLFDMDHVCCKLYLNLARTVGTRTYSAPRPSASQCWPLVVDNLTNDQRLNFKRMTEAFQELVDAGRWEGVLGSCFEQERPDKSSNTEENEDDGTSNDIYDNGVPEEDLLNNTGEEQDDNAPHGDAKKQAKPLRAPRKGTSTKRKAKRKKRGEKRTWTESDEEDSEEDSNGTSSLPTIATRHHCARAVTQHSQSYREVDGSELSTGCEESDDECSYGWD